MQLLISNFRYSICNVVENKYGICIDDNLIKLSKDMNVPFEDLKYLIKEGAINEKNFENICEYLNPPNELKKIWRQRYVYSDSEFKNREQKKFMVIDKDCKNHEDEDCKNHAYILTCIYKDLDRKRRKKLVSYAFSLLVKQKKKKS